MKMSEKNSDGLQNKNILPKLNDELESINIYQHLRRNILDPKINCKETLSNEIYYCITCKQSTCEKCSLNKHKNHTILPKTVLYFISAGIGTDKKIIPTTIE